PPRARSNPSASQGRSSTWHSRSANRHGRLPPNAMNTMRCPIWSHFRARNWFRKLFLTLLLLGGALSGAAQSISQSFPLRVGWNSIWLEVDPTNAATHVVLAGAPFASVWTFADRLSAVDFIENPNEPVWNRDRWLRAVPAG